MPQSLNSLYPNVEDVIALSPAELGQVFLNQILLGDKTFNRNNLNLEAIRGYPQMEQQNISRAAMEALSWLVRQGLIAESDQTGWYFVTAEGKAFRQTSNSPDPTGKAQGQTNVEQNSFEQDDSDMTPENDSSERDEPSLRVETIFRSGISDQPATKDTLGFEPYVRAIADFLTDESTEPPLTLSIEGEWGSGKSSFMLQLRDALRSRGNLTVSFDAWRHDKADELWAAFALDFIRQISHEQRFWRRWWANINLRRRRYDWTGGTLDIVRTLATWGFLVAAGLAVPTILLVKGWGWASEVAQSIVAAMGEKGDIWTGVVNSILKIGGGSAILLISATLWLKLRKLIGNPITLDLKRHLKLPNYEERVAFVERFHRDLDKIVSSYVGKRKVYVFIDDLDRCDVPKASDLMQAINLMIDNDPKLFFIVGIDREKIAAGLAIKYEKLLTYINALPPAQPDNQLDAEVSQSLKENNVDPWIGLEFGYRFIEKFIQLPFRIPAPSDADLENLLNVVKPKTQSRIGPLARLRKIVEKMDRKRNRPTIKSPDIVGARQPEAKVEETEKSLPRRKQILNLISGESESNTIRRIILMVVPTLGHNPRRMKQFVNLFRLKAHIAYETGLFDTQESGDLDATLTLEQLGKFVALSLMYPRLLADLDIDRQLLKKLDLRSRKLGLAKPSDFTEAVVRWEHCKEVMDLISYGREDIYSTATDKFGLGRLNVDQLMRVSPYVPRQQLGLRNVESPERERMEASSRSDVREPDIEAKTLTSDTSDRLPPVKQPKPEERTEFPDPAQLERDIAEAIVGSLYEAWENHKTISLNVVQEQGGWERSVFRAVVDRLEDEGFIRSYGTSFTFKITSAGIARAEERRIAPKENIKRHQRIRNHVLTFLINLYKTEGSRAHAHYEKIAADAPVSQPMEILQDVSYLTDINEVEAASTSSFRITSYGLQKYRGAGYEII